MIIFQAPHPNQVTMNQGIPDTSLNDTDNTLVTVVEDSFPLIDDESNYNNVIDTCYDTSLFAIISGLFYDFFLFRSDGRTPKHG